MALKSKMGASTTSVVELRILREVYTDGETRPPEREKLKFQYRRKNSPWYDIPIVDVDANTGKMIDDED
jgi:hypothetical protein